MSIKYSKLIAFLVGLIALSSCGTSKYICQEEFDQIKNVAVVTPFTDIEIIEGRDSIVFDSEATAEFADLITESLMSSALPTGKYLLMDLSNPIYANAVLSLRNVNPKFMDDVRVPRELVNFLKQNNQRFGVFCFANGFLTNNKHYAAQMALGVLAAVISSVISLGTITYVNNIPEKNSFQLWLAVIDSETNKIVFFNSDSRDGENPTKEKRVKKAVDKLLKDFEKK